MKPLYVVAILVQSLCLLSCYYESDLTSHSLNENSIKLGIAQALRGNPINIQGQAATMAVDEINAAGGINGVDIELIIRDSGCSSSIAPDEVQRMIDDYQVVAIVGPTCSSGAKVIITDILSYENVPTMGTTTTSPDLTTLDTNGLFYRLRTSDLVQISTLVEEIISDGVTQLAIIHRGGNDVFNIAIAQGLMAQFNAQIGTQGSTIVDYPEASLTDFHVEVNELFDAGSFDGIAIIGFPVDSTGVAASVALEMSNRGIARSDLNGVYINLIPGINDSVLLPIYLELLTGSKSIRFSEPSNLTAPNFSNWLVDFNARYPNTNFTLLNEDNTGKQYAYDGVYLMALAMLQGGVTQETSVADTRSLILDNLTQVSGSAALAGAVEIKPGEFALAISTLESGGTINYNGASGLIDFDEFGEVNYADLQVMEAVQENQKIMYSCLRGVRIFATPQGFDSEAAACLP